MAEPTASPQPTTAVGRHPISRAIRAVNAAAAVAAALMSGAIMAGLVISVAWRGLTQASMPGLIELVELFMIFVVYLGLGHAEHTQAHVRMTIVTSRLPPIWRRRVLIVTRLIVCAGALMFIVGTGQRAVDATLAGEFRPGLFNFPVWPGRLIIAFGFVLLLLEGLIKLAESVRSSLEELFPPHEEGAVPLV